MTKTKRQKVIDQLHQILRQAGDKATTVAEAETALLLAQRIAGKYAIDLARLPPESGASGAEGVMWVELTGGMVPKHWRTLLLACITKNFRCSMVELNEPAVTQFTKKATTKKSLHIVGHREDVEVAARAFMYAVNVGEEQVLRYLLDHRDELGSTEAERRAAGESWCEGYVNGIRAKFRAQVKRSPGAALMVITPDDVTQAVDAVTDNKAQAGSVAPEHRNVHFLYGWHTGRESGDGHIGVEAGNVAL